MAQGSLTNDGLGLALIGAVIALITIGLGYFGENTTIIEFSGVESLLGSGTLATVIIVALILVLYFIAVQRIQIGEPAIMGILILLIGVLIGGLGGFFAAFGGIIIILDALFEGS